MISKKTKYGDWFNEEQNYHRFSGYSDTVNNYFYVLSSCHCLYDQDSEGWCVNNKELCIFKKSGEE